MGRKAIELTDEQIAQVEALGATLSLEQVADYLGIGKNTFYRMMERNPEVMERYKRGKAKAIDGIADSLLAKARNGDTTSMIFYLKTQAGWRETNRVDHVSSDGSMSPGKKLEDMTDEELLKIVNERTQSDS